MRRVLFLVGIACIMACNNRKQSNSNASDTDSIEEFSEVVESVEHPTTTSPSSEISLDFSSYHLYTCEEDKYDASGYQPVNANVTINEEARTASLKLYDNGTKLWYPFSFSIKEKVNVKDGIVVYMVNSGYIYVSTNRANGLFIDINSFIFEGDRVCCWMQEGGSSGAEYRNRSVNVEELLEESNSVPSFNPNLNNGNVHSDERVYDNFSNYKETDDCVEGVVVYEGEGDCYIVETRRGYTVLERYNGRLDEGDKVRGELNKYSFKYLYNRNNDSEVRVYIENYMLSEDRAIEWMGDNDHLKSDDQEAYDYKKNNN